MSQRLTPASRTCNDSLGDPHAYDYQMARGKADATRLRNEVIREFGTHAFANFWRDANAVWHRMEASVGSTARSARRLQIRLDKRQAPMPSA